VLTPDRKMCITRDEDTRISNLAGDGSNQGVTPSVNGRRVLVHPHETYPEVNLKDCDTTQWSAEVGFQADVKGPDHWQTWDWCKEEKAFTYMPAPGKQRVLSVFIKDSRQDLKGDEELQAALDVDGVQIAALYLSKYHNAPSAAAINPSLSSQWEMHEFVRHSRCANKRYKVLKFDGSLFTTVSYRGWAAMPSTQVTLMMWLKPTLPQDWTDDQGTFPFSYAKAPATCDSVVCEQKPRYKTMLGLSINPARGTKNSQAPNYLPASQSGAKNYKIGVTVFNEQVYDFDQGGDDKGEVLIPPGWFHVAVTADIQSAKKTQVKVYLNGEKKGEQDFPDLGEAAFLTSGCIMFGHRAERPCKERVKASSYKGSMADILIIEGILNAEEITTKMFKPVDPEWIDQVTVTTDATPSGGGIDEAIKLAILTRQYSKEERGDEATCRLSPTALPAAWEPPMSATASALYTECLANPSLSHCNLVSDEFRKPYGVGDPHYQTFAGCNWDDMSVGVFAVVQMFPEVYASFPLTVQFSVKPLERKDAESWCSWCAAAQEMTVWNRGKTLKAHVKLEMYLGYIAGAAVQFGKDLETGTDFERAATVANPGSMPAKISKWVSPDTVLPDATHTIDGWVSPSGGVSEYQRGPGTANIVQGGCNPFSTDVTSQCYSQHFTGYNSNSAIDVSMKDYPMHFTASQGRITIIKMPMFLSAVAGTTHTHAIYTEPWNGNTPYMKVNFGGLFGNSRGLNPTTDYVAGWNKKAIHALTELYGTASVAVKCGGGGPFGGSSGEDCANVAAYAPIKSLMDSTSGGQTNGGGCDHGVTGKKTSDFNGNQFWKGQTKLMNTWRINLAADGTMRKIGTGDYVSYENYANAGIIASIYGKISDDMVLNGGDDEVGTVDSVPTKLHWRWAQPQALDPPEVTIPVTEATEKAAAFTGAHDVAQANAVCGDNIDQVQNPGNAGNCVFDQDEIGGDAFSENVGDIADAQKTVKADISSKTVRDVGMVQYKGMSWVADANWGCVEDFARHLAGAYKKWQEKQFHSHHNNANFKDNFCTCKECGGRPSGTSCAYDHFMCILKKPDGYGYVKEGRNSCTCTDSC